MLKSALAEARERIFGAAERRTAPLSIVRAYADEVDRALREIYTAYIHGENSCLIALGGYGRRELCPFSDVDVLILHADGADTDEIAAAVRNFWDIGLTMGCVVRTIDQCGSILGQDIATDTALLECRCVAGNAGLFDELQSSCIKPFFTKRKKAYIDELCSALREGLFSSENTLFRVEPDLKNGICTLRDCQRLLWAERVRRGAFGSVPDVFSLLPPQDAAPFESDYAFLTGLRIELHLLAKRRMDILETGFQPPIAENYGFGPQGAGELIEIFFKAVRDIRLFLLSFLEKDLSGKNIWSIVRKRISAYAIAPGISVLDGIIFDTGWKTEECNTPSWIMGVFISALKHRATLSVELRNKLRRLAAHFSHHDFKSQATGETFRKILSHPGPVGPVMQMMHDTEVLGKLIPQFSALTCKVEYDSYHEFTVDEHILLAIGSSDALADDSDERIRKIYAALKRPVLLRMGLLLHDIGKLQPGDHAGNGTIIAENVCEGLGFEPEEIERIKFIIYHHLEMSDLSLMREPEDHIIRRFAEALGDAENLDLLYLLTICDIRSVGRHTWTNWKGFQLEQLYERTLDFIREPHGHREVPSRHNLLITEDSYFSEILPKDQQRHHEWLADLGADELQLHHDSFEGFERLTVCGSDRAGFLCDLIGCISSEGYNVLNARVYSTEDGKVLDIFYLEPLDQPRLTWEEKVQNILRKWRLIETGEITADDLVLERIRKYPLPALRYVPAKPPLQVRVDNNASPLCTVIEIDAADNFGLLHKIARCFNENKVNIISARLSTRADLAVDVFYVSDLSARKITDLQFLNALEKDLVRVLS